MEHSEEEVDDMFQKMEQLLDDETKGKDCTIVMVDFNAVVGEGKEDGYVGHYGLGHPNDPRLHSLTIPPLLPSSESEPI